MKIEKTEGNNKIICHNDYFGIFSFDYAAAGRMGIILFPATGRKTDNDYLGLVSAAIYLNELS